MEFIALGVGIHKAKHFEHEADHGRLCVITIRWAARTYRAVWSLTNEVEVVINLASALDAPFSYVEGSAHSVTDLLAAEGIQHFITSSSSF